MNFDKRHTKIFERLEELFGEQAAMAFRYSMQIDLKKYRGVRKFCVFPIIWDNVGFIYTYENEVLKKLTVKADVAFAGTMQVIAQSLIDMKNVKNCIIEVCFLEEWFAQMFQKEIRPRDEQGAHIFDIIQEILFLHSHDGTKVTFVCKDAQPGFLSKIRSDLCAVTALQHKGPLMRLNSLLKGLPPAYKTIEPEIRFDKVRSKSYTHFYES